jgi:hypothetical protein
MSKLDKLLPDFEDMLKLVDEIKNLQFQKTLMDLDIKNKIADIYLTTSTDTTYYVGGKPPSVSFVKVTYEQVGLKKELIPIRNNLAELTAELRKLENKLAILRDMIDVWRTLSANERATTI